MDLWQLMMEHSPIGMAIVAPDGRLLAVNRALCEMLGYGEDELTRRGFQELTHPDDLDADLAMVAAALAGEIDSFRLRKRYRHADGRLVWGDLSAALVRNAEGAPLHFISQILDVTERHENEERLEAIFEAVNVGLLLIGPDGTYERMNRRHAETMQLPFPDGHAGTAGQLGEVYFPDGKTLMKREDMPSYRATQGEEFDDYWYWVGADPATRAAFSTSARQVRGSTGERLGAALAYQEITELMRAIRVKDEFVASVSHELRTPLTSVLGRLEILCEREDLAEDVAAQLRVVQRNAHRLQALLTDLLMIGQIADGSFELDLEQVDLAAVLVEALDAVQVSADRAGVALHADLPDQAPVLADARRIRQVVDNLLSNAVKYSPSGGEVTVTLGVVADHVVIEVTDTGIGIAADEVEHVFGRFFRGGEAITQQVPGTGLGLSIVASIVDAHGGTVSAESELGRGSTFRVVLPGRHD